MQTDFQVQWVPLPAERQGEWRHTIELIVKITKEYAMTIDTTTNKYRFAWVFAGESQTHYGTFLFNEPTEAKTTFGAMQILFRNAIIWLEDHEHNRVEIPQ